MSLGSRINEIRREKNISIDELSDLSGVPKGTLSKITAGITTNPTLETVKAIARALGCRLDDFDDDPSQKNSRAQTPGSADYGKYKDILAAEGIRVLFDADADVTDAQMEEIIEFIRFKRRTEQH